MSDSYFVIVEIFKPFNNLNLYSAYSAVIALLVKPPTHGWSSLKEFKGDSVKFK